MKTMTRCHENHDEFTRFDALTVMKTMTSLSYHTVGGSSADQPL